MAPRDPLWTQNGNYTGGEDRTLPAAMFGARHFVDLAPQVTKVDAGGGHGVVGAGDLAVTAGAGHTVNVAAGLAMVRGTQQGDQGTYVGPNDAAHNVACGAPDATNPRIILIQARITDTEFGAGASAFVLDAKIGAPAGVPVVPTPDENCLVLAEVLQPAAAASSASYTITDRRTRAYALGGVAVCTSATRPNPVTEGQLIWETDTDRLKVWTGAAWRTISIGQATIPGSTGINFVAANSVTGTVNFGVTFAVAPKVVGTLEVGANNDVLLNWTGPATTTGRPYRVFQKAGISITTAATIDWIAVGELA